MKHSPATYAVLTYLAVMVLAAALIIPGTVTVAATGEQLSLRMKIVSSTLFPFYAGYKGSVYTIKALKWLPGYLVECAQKLFSMLPKMLGGFRKVLATVWEHVSIPLFYIGRKLADAGSRIARALFDITWEVGVMVVRTIRVLYNTISSVARKIGAWLRVALDWMVDSMLQIFVIVADLLAIVVVPLRRFVQFVIIHTKDLILHLQTIYFKARQWISTLLLQVKESLVSVIEMILEHVFRAVWWLIKKIFVVINFIWDVLSSLYSKLATGIRFIWMRATAIFWFIVDIAREPFMFVWNLLNDILFMPVYEAIFTVAKAIWNVIANNYEAIVKILADMWAICSQAIMNQMWLLKESIVTLFTEMREVFIVTLDSMTTTMWQAIDTVQTILQQSYEACMNILN